MAARIIPSGARSISSIAREEISSGAVHIRVYPRPRILAESREILRVLEGYGEIVMYKHLKYEPLIPAPNTILAIYQAPSSAQKLISVSPFRVKLEKKESGWTYAGSEILNEIKSGDPAEVSGNSDASNKSRPEEECDIEDDKISSDKANKAASNIEAKDKGFQGLGGWHKWGPKNRQASPPSAKPPNKALPPRGSLSDPTILPSPDKGTQADQSTAPTLTSTPVTAPIREFQLWVAPSHMNHQAYIQRQGYYASFIPNRKTIMAADLEDRVPLAGLSDCRLNKQEIPLRRRIKTLEKGLGGPFSIRALWDKRHASREDSARSKM